MHSRRIRHVAAVSLLSFLASLTIGCSGGSAIDEPPDDENTSAITVAQAKSAEAAPLITNVPAVNERATGASKWHLYTTEASDLGKLHASFSGLIAYGTDRDDQVVWTIVIDKHRPDAKGVQRIDRDGRAMLSTITPELSKAFDAELSNLHEALSGMTKSLTPAPEPRRGSRGLSPGAALALLETGVLSVGGLLGYASIGMAGVMLGASIAILPAVLILVVFAEMMD